MFVGKHNLNRGHNDLAFKKSLPAAAAAPTFFLVTLNSRDRTATETQWEIVPLLALPQVPQ